MTRVTKAILVVVAAGLAGVSNNSADAFWGHRRAAYAPVAVAPVVSVPVTAGYYPAAPIVVGRPMVVSPPIIAASPVVTSGYAPAVAPVTNYYAPPTTNYYAPAAPAVAAPALVSPTTTYYAPPVTGYYAPAPAYYPPTMNTVVPRPW